jgi:hypothetical protein
MDSTQLIEQLRQIGFSKVVQGMAENKRIPKQIHMSPEEFQQRKRLLKAQAEKVMELAGVLTDEQIEQRRKFLKQQAEKLMAEGL